MWNPFKKKISSEDAYKSNFYLAFTSIPIVVELSKGEKIIKDLNVILAK